MNPNPLPTDPQTAIAQTTQPAENPMLNIIPGLADRYPASFEWWVWLFLIIQLLKAIADLLNRDDD